MIIFYPISRIFDEEIKVPRLSNRQRSNINIIIKRNTIKWFKITIFVLRYSRIKSIFSDKFYKVILIEEIIRAHNNLYSTGNI